MKPAHTSAQEEVEVRIRGLMMDPVTSMPMIVLKDIGGDAVLPIWVGIFEANAIALEIEKNTTPRPMTHDLIRNILRGFETHVTRVVISDLREDTFYAVIWLERGGETLAIDARPSDALALAMRADCPIFVARSVLDSAKANSAGRDSGNSDELRRWLENLNDDDLGKYKM
ncbi:bifunctional nuclease family protein [Terriglobus aquaticus]|uniref:Bifunctional nuclease family protein n=1 Tax=Terriglobus aquaticus TaxID=940139 RepID=A0ABW9KJU1_9BACT|nr:bifunctional nuclease family protein [Terriglobus aquaticus]